MRILSLAFVLLTIGFSAIAQERMATPPEERLGWSLDQLLQPEKSDKAEAKRLGLQVFRILPREVYDGKIDIRGGGAYYSFVINAGAVSNGLNPPDYVKVPGSPSRPLMGPSVVSGAPTGLTPTSQQNSNNGLASQGFKMEQNQETPGVTALSPHSYGYGSDISLEKGDFLVGFAGADYGFLYDLENIPLADISLETPAVKFLASYKPPRKTAEVRAEQSKLFQTTAYEANGFSYKRSVSAVVGHTYVLRSLNFRRSDVLVALKVYRQDTDGSLIVFWKKIKTFSAPELVGDETK